MSKYSRKIVGLRGVTPCTVEVDVYDVLKAFEVVDPALQHLIKKALAVGQRGHKTVEEDLKDIVASANRALTMYQMEQHEPEWQLPQAPAPMPPTVKFDNEFATELDINTQIRQVMPAVKVATIDAYDYHVMVGSHPLKNSVNQYYFMVTSNNVGNYSHRSWDLLKGMDVAWNRVSNYISLNVENKLSAECTMNEILKQMKVAK